MSVLYVVATPIGNLEDVSRRAIRVLSEVDLILCEDTRITKKLLDCYGIKTPTISYHQHSKIKKVDYLLNLLKEGKSLALVSDAGTPGISDPGGKLIHEIITRPGLVVKIVKIVPVPGSSALTAAASISGFPMDKFLFLGFPPAKRKRKKFFEEIIHSKYPVIFYESPHRILRTLNELHTYEKGDRLIREYREIVVSRELTKKFETIYRGNISEIIKKLEGNKNNLKGEFVIIVSK
jgi:16S rRNA (cytidine1402-2'-O)-methyltransferase